ncbi:MAG: hypothetical protein ACUVS6_07505 [Anaerolineae bacterium]
MTRMTVREAISQALREEMYRDERVFIMGEEIGKWGGTYAVTRGFLDEFGEKRIRPARQSLRVKPSCWLKPTKRPWRCRPFATACCCRCWCRPEKVSPSAPPSE